jgi:uncharacterized protein YdaU (DUF1376 family)
MAEFPALPLWSDAYLADTRHLTQAEHGAYLLLLLTAWRTPDCALPDDDKLLARYACCDKRAWARQKPVIMAFWRLADGKWTQKRLSEERAYVADLSSKRAEAGGKGGRARVRAKALKDKEIVEAKLADCSSKIQAPTPTPIFTEEVRTSSGTGAPPDTLEKRAYDIGKSILGKGAGGQVTRLRKHHNGDLAATLRTLERAKEKSSPAEWIAGLLRGEVANTEDFADETRRQYAAMGVAI